jgi:hypothetical protein
MAQPGSVLVWGARGRGFKSRYPDFFILRLCFRQKTIQGLISQSLPILIDHIQHTQAQIKTTKPSKGIVSFTAAEVIVA